MWELRKRHPGERPGKLDYIRMFRTMGGNIEDAESLGQALEVIAAAEEFIAEAVGVLRAEGYSWEEIARGAKLTRQGARKRWLVAEARVKTAKAVSEGEGAS